MLQTPSLWIRYVDVLAVSHKYFVDELHKHMNSIDQYIYSSQLNQNKMENYFFWIYVATKLKTVVHP